MSGYIVPNHSSQIPAQSCILDSMDTKVRQNSNPQQCQDGGGGRTSNGGR